MGLSLVVGPAHAGKVGQLLEGFLASADRDRILASLHLDTVAFDREGSPVLLDLGGTTAANGPSRTPAWLVHAALKAGAAVGFPFRVDDHLAPLRAQILTRTARVPWSSDAVPLLEKATRLEFAGGLSAKILPGLSLYAQAGYQFAVSPTDGGRRDGVKGDFGVHYAW